MKIFLQTLFFFLLVTQICFAQWVHTNGPYGGWVNTLAVNGTNFFAGTGHPMGGHGDVFLSTNNGNNWTAVSTGLPNASVEVLAVSADGTNLFAGTVFGGVFRSTNNGMFWTEANGGLLPFNKWITSFAVNGNNLFTSLYYEGVFLSTNNGQSWTPSGLSDHYVHSLFVTPDGMNLFAGAFGGIFRSTDNGTSWDSVSTGLPQLTTVISFAASGTNIFAGTYADGIFLSTNNGTNWTSVNSGLDNIHTLAISGTNIFAGTDSGVFLSTDNGTSWNSTGLANMEIRAFTISSNGTGGTSLFAGVIPDEGIFLSTDNGTTWTEVNNGLTNINVSALAVSSNGSDGTNLFAGTWWKGVFLSTNNGASWTPSGLSDYFIYALFVTPNGTNLFAGAQGIFRSSDNGTSWDSVNTGLPQYTQVFSFAASGTTLFAGTSEGVFLSTNNGTNWTAVNSGLTNDIRTLAISETNIFAGTDNGVFLSTDNGTSWNSAGLSNLGINAFTLSSNGNLFAGTNGSGIFTSTDNSASWTQANSGLPLNSVVYAFTVVGANIFTAISSTFDTLGIYLSTDNGASWSAVNSGLPNVNVRSLTISGMTVFAGTEGRAVWCRPLLEMVPVELTSFTATANGKEVTLNWSTATELNNQGFEVQRKFGSNEFVTIGSVKGHGTTTSHKNYTYVDKLIDAGKYFYRLKQIDYGGKYEYSQTVEINWSPFTTYKLEQNYPNPFNPTTTIGFGIMEKGNVRLSVLNILGEEIKVLLNEEKEAGYHSVDFNASELPSGVYFYRIQAGNFIDTKKMILLR